MPRRKEPGTLTEQQKEKFLEYVREGHLRPEAARKVGSTGSRFRALSGRDEEFNRLYEEAASVGEPAWHERLRQEYRRRAFLSSDKLLHHLATVTLPEFKVLLETRFRVGNLDGDAFRLAAAQHLDLSKLSDEEVENLRQILLKAQREEDELEAAKIAQLPGPRSLSPAAEA